MKNPLNYCLATVVFLGAFALYLYSSVPAIGWGDGGDFVLNSYFFGVPHPTGYPLIILLGKMLSFIPLGDIAFRMVLLSSLCSAGAVTLLFFLVKNWGQNTPAALYAAAVLVISTFLWSTSITVEAYALNIFLCLALISISLHTDDFRFLPGIFLFGALALGNHGTIIFPLLVLGFSAIVIAWKNKQFGKFLSAASLVALVGISLYIALPLFSARTDIFDWNQPEHFRAMPALLSGSEFWMIGEYETSEMWKSAVNLAGDISRQITPFAIIPIFFAFFLAPGNHLKKIRAIFAIFILSSVFPIVYTTKEKESFFLISFTLLVLLCGTGLGFILNFIWQRARMRTLFAAVIIILLVVHVYFLAVANGKYFANRQDASGEEYSTLIFNSAPRDALIFVDHIADDSIIPPLYFQFVLNQRRDVFVFHRLFLVFPWYMDAMRNRAREIGNGVKIPRINMAQERYRLYAVAPDELQRTLSTDIQTLKLIEANLPYRSVFINTPSRFRVSLLAKGLNFLPHGWLFRIAATEIPASTKKSFHIPRTTHRAPRTMNYVFRSIMYEYFYEKALSEIMRKDYAAAVKSLQNATAYKETQASRALLMQLYFQMGDKIKGKQELKKYLKQLKIEHDIH